MTFTYAYVCSEIVPGGTEAFFEAIRGMCQVSRLLQRHLPRLSGVCPQHVSFAQILRFLGLRPQAAFVRFRLTDNTEIG
jgi:hypothetical protein